MQKLNIHRSIKPSKSWQFSLGAIPSCTQDQLPPHTFSTLHPVIKPPSPLILQPLLYPRFHLHLSGPNGIPKSSPSNRFQHWGSSNEAGVAVVPFRCWWTSNSHQPQPGGPKGKVDGTSFGIHVDYSIRRARCWLSLKLRHNKELKRAFPFPARSPSLASELKGNLSRLKTLRSSNGLHHLYCTRNLNV